MLPTNLQFQNKKEKYTTVEAGIPVNEGQNGNTLTPHLASSAFSFRTGSQRNSEVPSCNFPTVTGYLELTLQSHQLVQIKSTTNIIPIISSYCSVNADRKFWGSLVRFKKHKRARAAGVAIELVAILLSFWFSYLHRFTSLL